MFVLLTVRDVIGISPSLLPDVLPYLHEGKATLTEAQVRLFRLALKTSIASRYVGRALPLQGFCVGVADVTGWGTCRVLNSGEGAVWTRAAFSLVAFRPFVGERIRGHIVSQTNEGIIASLHFIKVTIPAAQLLSGSIFDAETQTWGVREEFGGPSSSDARIYKKGAECLLVVTSVSLAGECDAVVGGVVSGGPVAAGGAVLGLTMLRSGVAASVGAATPLVSPRPATQHAAATPAGLPAGPMGQKDQPASKDAAAALKLEGSFNGDGLGPVTWWA